MLTARLLMLLGGHGGRMCLCFLSSSFLDSYRTTGRLSSRSFHLTFLLGMKRSCPFDLVPFYLVLDE